MSSITRILCISFVSVFISTIAIKAQLTENDKYDFSDGQYYFETGDLEQALKFFLKLSNKYPENSRFNYCTGLCYISMQGEEDKALPYLQKSVTEIDPKYSSISTKNSGAPPEAWLYLGDAQHRAGNYKDASFAYHTYITYVLEKPELLKRVYKRIQGLGISYEASLRQSGYTLSNIGEVVNSKYSDYNPVLSGDQLTMAFTSFRDPKDKIYISSNVNGTWAEPVDITALVGSKGDCYVTSLTYSGDELYLSNYDPFNSDIFVAKKVKGKWTKMAPLDKKINSKFHESGAYMSADGSTFFFCSNRSGGFGGFDIYYSTKTGDVWSKPFNIGEILNTSENETHPVISPDGNMLFFSSDGHESIGGMDILWSAKDNNGNWQPPVNFGVPINTPGNDESFWFYNNKQPGYISRLSENSFGKRDIYQVSYTEPPPIVFEQEPQEQVIIAEVIKEMVDPEKPKANEVVETLIPVVETVLPANIVPVEEKKVVEVPVEEPKKIEVSVEKTITIVKETPPVKEQVVQKAQTGQYTIQIMALLKPRDAIIFSRLDKGQLKMSYGNDGYCRYTYGRYESQPQAITDLKKMVRIGFKDAFIRDIGEIDNY